MRANSPSSETLRASALRACAFMAPIIASPGGAHNEGAVVELEGPRHPDCLARIGETTLDPLFPRAPGQRPQSDTIEPDSDGSGSVSRRGWHVYARTACGLCVIALNSARISKCRIWKSEKAGLAVRPATMSLLR